MAVNLAKDDPTFLKVFSSAAITPSLSALVTIASSIITYYFKVGGKFEQQVDVEA